MVEDPYILYITRHIIKDIMNLYDFYENKKNHSYAGGWFLTFGSLNMTQSSFKSRSGGELISLKHS